MTILPNFLVAGAAKCGTTSLYYFLRQHPDVFMSSPKEPDYFFGQTVPIPTGGRGDECQEVVRTWADYSRLFESARGRRAIGEASHTNLYGYRKIIPLIKRDLGDPKIVIILRNPVDRAFSNFTALSMQGREYLAFEDALREEPRRMEANWRPVWYYRDLGLYAHQVRAYMSEFSSVKVCLFDDLMRDPLSLCGDLYRFLDVDAAFEPVVDTRHNASGIPRFKPLRFVFSRKRGLPHRIARGIGLLFMDEDRWCRLRDGFKARLLTRSVMRPDTRRFLQDVYREDIRELQSLIGRDLSGWLKQPA